MTKTNKKLLLIMPMFFDYPQIIKRKLYDMGYDVDVFDDRPSTSGWVKAAVRIDRNLLKNYIKHYFDTMMSTIGKNHYHVVLLISGQSLSLGKDMIETIRASQPQALFVLYQWDSLHNFPYIAQMHCYFDKLYTFDRHDAAQNDQLKFLPLFYCERYEQIKKLTSCNFQYDFCFVGTAHPKKYKLVNRMSAQLKPVYPNQFIYFFYPSRLVFFYRKLRNRELRKSHYGEFHFTPLSGKEMEDIFKASRCVLDSAQSGQTGLTIRVLEALGAGKKLITTNEDVKNYDFYRPENIYIYDGDIDMSSPFFTEPYREIDDVIYEKYSLRSWLEELLSP